jgi:hypothetical protein
MTPEEIKAWDELYQYVKFNILGYEKEMNLPKYMVLKLKELRTGRMFARKDRISEYEYTYEDILLTFKFCIYDIAKAIINKQFKDEKGKFYYIMAIVSNKINDVILEKRRMEKSIEKSQNHDTEHIEADKAQYKTKSKETNKRLKELW